eukprot:CAMPEP_0180638336 /NCGR_PEP_ID=MMETSP1037_2-20121125/44263_1 /TAXON_ID=632150 /ORGANISM="Azadinium spinosum, Strain 3D9" /LENGTH=143 /DNA_ID=CAMNT_0022659843 /DNA_START=46 /DNA_END=477 /DNA_ORIENTATION=-
MGAKCCSEEQKAEDSETSLARRDPQATETVAKSVSPLTALPAQEAGKSQSASKGSLFTVIIEKRPDVRLGIDVDLTHGVDLLVDKVKSGLVDEWNQDNPTKAVKENDIIISVNGVKGECGAMTDEVKASDKLELVVKRGSASP